MKEDSMLWRWRKLCMAVVVVGVAGCSARFAEGASPAGKPVQRAPRRTPLIKLVDRCSRAAVDITGGSRRKDGQWRVAVGSGTIIHEAGYVLTNHHAVVGTRLRVHLSNGKSYPYRSIVRIPDQDLALVKFDPDEPLEPAPLGRTHDLMLGESIVVVGNPMGLRHSVSTGIVSGLDRVSPTPGAFLKGVIQTNAAITGGNSGGPLFNGLGEMIGVVASTKLGMQSVSFAIAIDTVRKVLPERLAVEERYGIRLGLAVDTFGPARVTAVEAGSPAAKAGVRVGDVIRRVGKIRVDDGIHFHLALIERKAGEVLPIRLRRGDEVLTVSVTLAEIPGRPPVEVPGLVNGLHYTVYKGNWSKLPDFDKLEPAGAGRTEKFSASVSKELKDQFGLKFTGYVEAPTDGVYAFYTASDDGSRLYIGDKLIVDNDGLHGVVEMKGSIRLKAGKHPITVTYFEAGGGEVLKVSYEGPKVGKQEIPPAALFVEP